MSIFAPLTDEERQAAPVVELFGPVPAPAGAEPPCEHPALGRYSQRWLYHGADGDLQGYVCRFDGSGGKEIRPLRYGRFGGKEGWHWQGWKEDRPLYRLPELLATPDGLVLVVEGEKAADAAGMLFPGTVAVTSLNGAGSPAKTDWSPLKGRQVVIWPDNDATGTGYATAVAELVWAAGGRPHLVEVPEGAPEGWDLADPLPEGWTSETLQVAIEVAVPFEPASIIQGSFKVQLRAEDGVAAGLYRWVVEKDPKTRETTAEWVWFASRIDVLGYGRDLTGREWCRLLAIHDHDGNVHPWLMPMELLAATGDEYRRRLLDAGIVLGPGKRCRDFLDEYLHAWRTDDRVRCVERPGWHGGIYVLPGNETFGDTGGERVILQTTGNLPELGRAGDLEGWRREIAGLAVGNSRLLFSISAAFAGPLIDLAGEESGGFHLHGSSSIGKTTCLHAARSVSGARAASWRTTDNAAETMARNACDNLLLLDEIGQATPQVVEKLTYMLGNQTGKARMRRDVTARAPITWRIQFLSTGEVGLGTKLAEIDRRAMAGQAARCLEIPADAGAGLGIFEELHDHGSAADLAEHLRLAADRHCGHALPAFLSELTTDLPAMAGIIRDARERFVAEHCPAGADGQVRRAAGRFGLVAAGELAVEFGILPWPPSAAENAAARCFADWLTARGGTGDAEITNGLRQVRRCLELHGSSRFEPWPMPFRAPPAGEEEPPEPVIHKTVNRAGFRRSIDGSPWVYYVLPEVWKNEVCKGFDPVAIARAMRDRDWLLPGPGNNLQRSERVPQHGMMRLYVIPGPFLSGEGI